MLGKEIRAAREALGLSQEKVAFAAGISRNYVSLLENERYTPTLDVFFRLCDALDLSAPDLIQKLDAKRRKKRRRMGK